ncbi:hypothetical protein L207DRAFT_564238 [Hyaloscypha variabilis F]|uniref:Uncharacterized protein n=1 Tax=Hyaloscypha variabilis (strain UAMH 11265 / GT02V1 / F) TaxID=1149755 RepID=A0A2J6RYK4_HYAVF|nr:hypothetical protein L207DRAFT_564238 [Hyaloscypha variabilis F]
MDSNDKYEEPSPAYSRPIVFRDPFAAVGGGIGNLSIAREANRAHASSNSTSTITASCAIFDEDNDSAAPSSLTSTTAASRDGFPSKSSPERGTEGDVPMSLPPQSNEFVLPFAELGPLDRCPSASPTSSSSIHSFGPDATSRSVSNIGYHDRHASFDGGAELPKIHGARLSPIPFTTSPAQVTRSASIAASVQSFKSTDFANDEWNTETLREMTDVVREALQSGSIPSVHLEILSEILKALLIDEQSQSTAVGIDLIALTYFDKTLDAILSHTSRNIAIAEPRSQEVFLRATSLQHKWQQRLKERYFTIDDIRIKDMKERALRGLSLNVADWRTDQMWSVTSNKPISLQQGDLGFEVGSWWPNIACAFRDGIVGEADEKATKGPYSVTALPLLTGEEIEGPTLDMYQYIKTGTSKEMPFSILGNRGGPVRILRGYALKSKFAPKIGVRYDGLHVVKQYGHKLADSNHDIYKCRLVLERVPGQKSMNDIIVAPAPSQLDDWVLYNRIVGEHIRARQGDMGYSEWREYVESQNMAKEEHIQKKELEASFPRHKLVARKKITTQN